MERHFAAPFMLETEYGTLAPVAHWASHLSALVRASVQYSLRQKVPFVYSKTILIQIYSWKV
jgi:hypothetical protein